MGKRFQCTRHEDFATSEAGDPVMVFQKAFDAASFHTVVNLGVGGIPFGDV